MYCNTSASKQHILSCVHENGTRPCFEQASYYSEGHGGFISVMHPSPPLESQCLNHVSVLAS